MYPSYQNSSNHNKGNLRLIAVVSLCALLVGVCIFGLVRAVRPPEGTPGYDSGGIVYDDAAVKGGWSSMTKEQIEAQLNQKLEDGYINISMNTAPIFANGSAEGNLMIVNEAMNTYPQKVEIQRNDTGEVIYTSGAIAVGSKIEKAKLDVELEPGSYECTALFHSLDPETGAILGSAGAIINLTIQSEQ